MSTSTPTVECDPLGTGESIEAQVLGEIPRSDGPERDLRVSYQGSTYRVAPERID